MQPWQRNVKTASTFPIVGISPAAPPIGAIIGEWVGASKGLGSHMKLANGRARIDLMFAALIVPALFTLLLHMTVDPACRRWLDGTPVG